MLEFDTTDNKFRDNLLQQPLNIQNQVTSNNGYVALPQGPGLGVSPDRDVLNHYNINNS
jgi:D-galactarolactone cycloisomerase